MAASLDATIPAGVVNEDAPHQLRGDAEEMGARIARPLPLKLA